MSEIRLTCLQCGAQYRVPASAIPAAGREVECSSCGNRWYQQGSTAPAEPAPPYATVPPVLSRPLPESILAILQEEAELARQQRAGQASGADGAAAGQTLTLDPSANDTASSRGVDNQPKQSQPDLPQQDTPKAVASLTTRQGTVQNAAAPAVGDRGYVRGLGWSLGLAAALLLVYLATPALADLGGVGTQLKEWRQSVDEGRLWLQDRVFGSQEK